MSVLSSIKDSIKNIIIACYKAAIAMLENDLSATSSADEDKRSKIQAEIDQKKAELEKYEENEKDSEKSDDFFDLLNQLKESGISHSIVKRNGMIGIKTGVSFSEALKNGWDEMKKHTSMLSEIWDKDFEAEKDAKYSDLASDQAGSSKFDPRIEEAMENLISVLSQNSKPNSHADREWYDDARVMESAHLSSDPKNRDNLELCGAVPIGGQLGNIGSEILESRIDYAISAAKSGKTPLMSFQVDENYWVGGAMAKDQEKMVFIHNDPFGNEMNKDLRKTLEDKGIEVVDMQLKQQNDGYNCGAYVADNLAKFADQIEESRGQNKDQNFDLDKMREDLSQTMSRDNGDELRQNQSKAINEARGSNEEASRDNNFAKRSNSDRGR